MSLGSMDIFNGSTFMFSIRLKSNSSTSSTCFVLPFLRFGYKMANYSDLQPIFNCPDSIIYSMHSA